MLPANVHHYLASSLGSTPALFAYALRDLTDAEADFRPDPDRFTIREVIAHLADWEGVWQERLTRTLEMEQPVLQGYDEGQWAIDHAYGQSDWHTGLRRIREGRDEILALLTDLTPEQWERVGNHSEAGPITVEAQALLIAVHDVHHLNQVTMWRDLWAGSHNKPM